MKSYILQRKIGRVIALIAERQGISQSQALKLFYCSKVGGQLHNENTGLYLMSDLYISDEFFQVETKKESKH